MFPLSLIEAMSPDPLHVTAETSEGKWQVWSDWPL